MGLLPMDLDIVPPSDDRVFKLILISPEVACANGLDFSNHKTSGN